MQHGRPTHPDHRSPRLPLNRGRIAEAAIALVEREGAAALTMRRVGAELGVEAMSLYHHIPSREALLDEMFSIVAERGRPLRLHADWRDTIREFCRALRESALAHPRTYPLIAHRPLRTDAVLRRADTLVAALRASGLSDSDAVSASRLVGAYAIGYVLDELALPHGQSARWPSDVPLPALAAVSGHIGEAAIERHFERGVELIIAGIEATRA